MPNIGFALTLGHFSSSWLSKLAHSFISSLMWAISRRLIFGFALFFIASAHHGRRSGWGNDQLRFSKRLYLFECSVRCEFAEDKSLGRYVNNGKFRNDVIHNFDTGKRQRALLQDFRLAVFGGVFHCNEDTLRSGY